MSVYSIGGHVNPGIPERPLDKGAGKIGPIDIGIELRRLATRALMPKAISLAKDILLPM